MAVLRGILEYNMVNVFGVEIGTAGVSGAFSYQVIIVTAPEEQVYHETAQEASLGRSVGGNFNLSMMLLGVLSV